MMMPFKNVRKISPQCQKSEAIPDILAFLIAYSGCHSPQHFGMQHNLTTQKGLRRPSAITTTAEVKRTGMCKPPSTQLAYVRR